MTLITRALAALLFVTALAGSPFTFAQTYPAPTATLLAAGNGFSLFLNPNTHLLFAAGNNTSAQLGQGDMNTYTSLVNVPVPTAGNPGRIWSQVSTSNLTSLGLASDGTLWGWGDNSSGQLAQGTPVTITGIVQLPLPALSPAGSTWIQASSGTYSTMALRSDGTLWGIGYNVYGELGNGLNVVSLIWTQVLTPLGAAPGTTWTKVVTANNSTMALRSDGTLWAWGINNNGQLGLGNATLYYTLPQQVPVPAGHPGATWTQFSIGIGTTAAILSDGTLFSAGTNMQGEAGTGSTSTAGYTTFTQEATRNTTWVQVSLGLNYTLARRLDGSMWVWGDNTNSQLGANPAITNYYTPVRESLGAPWQDVAAGRYHSLARLANGRVYGAGDNSQKQLSPLTGSIYPVFTLMGNPPLPVELLAFTAERTAPESVALSWETASETNNLGFGIEQSADGKIWEEVAFVPGNGTTSQARQYARVLPATPEAAYYRLRQDDLNGLSQYSPLAYIPAIDGATAGPLLPWPNPATTAVQVPATGAETVLTLLDNLGRTVAHGTGSALPLRGVSPGLYVLRAAEPGQPARTAQLVVE